MFKIIKAIAPVLLVVFCSVCIVGPCWGEEKLNVNILDCNDDGSLLLTPIKVGQKLRVKVQAYYKNQALKDVKISSSNGFKTLNVWAENSIFDQKSSYTVFELDPPSESGKYVLTFEGINIDGEKVSFQHEIEVNKGDSVLFKTLGVCFLILFFLAIGNMGGAGRN